MSANEDRAAANKRMIPALGTDTILAPKGLVKQFPWYDYAVRAALHELLNLSCCRRNVVTRSMRRKMLDVAGAMVDRDSLLTLDASLVRV